MGPGAAVQDNGAVVGLEGGMYVSQNVREINGAGETVTGAGGDGGMRDGVKLGAVTQGFQMEKEFGGVGVPRAMCETLL